MPSVRYYNQTAPFWDWVSDLEGRGNGFAEEEHERDQFNPWTQGWATFPFGPLPHRGRGPPPPPPPHHDGPPAPPAAENDEAGPSRRRGPPPPFPEDQDKEGHHHEHPHHGPRRGGLDRDGHENEHDHHGPRRGGSGGRGGRCGRGRGPPGGRERGPFHPCGGFGSSGPLAEMLQSQLFGHENENSNSKDTDDLKPEVDVFDTADSFVVHVSLPGAKKEDVGVNWDAEKSELNIAGVVYRPGDEEFLKTLALAERKVGAFERKVRLGSRANPAQVDVDGIVARLEDGILRIEVPKQDAGYVEIRKVDIE